MGPRRRGLPPAQPDFASGCGDRQVWGGDTSGTRPPAAVGLPVLTNFIHPPLHDPNRRWFKIKEAGKAEQKEIIQVLERCSIV